MARKEKNNIIRREIEVVSEQLKSVASTYDIIMLTNKLNYLTGQLDKDFDNKLNSDRLVEQANRELVSYNTRPFNLFNSYNY